MEEKEEEKKVKKHLIKNKIIRRCLKTIGWIIFAVLLIPVLLYIPPIQTLVKNIACSYIAKSTGMKVQIDRFRLGFPLNLSLDGVTVIEASGDTLAAVTNANVDVALMPLLSLDVKVKKLDLNQGYYRMVSPDSSMIMKIRAGKLTVDDKSNANIAKSEIHLGKAFLKDGNVSLYMNVWKQKSTPADTTSTPFLITADDLEVENMLFGMSMLPTIDTLNLTTASLRLRKGIINLRNNNISIGFASVGNGEMKYITPTPEYIATHPAPPPGPPSAPMTITGDSLALTNFKALYAVKGAKPTAGFDPSYISADGVSISLKNFYNQSSTVKLPITSMTVGNLAGMNIVEGKGIVAIDSVGLNLSGLQIATPYTSLTAAADIPFAMMEMQPSAQMMCKATGHIGLPDMEAFMPALKPYTSKLPGRNPLDFVVDASGSLERLTIEKLDVGINSIFSVNASGFAGNVLDLKKLYADIDFKGTLKQPQIIEAFTGKTDFNIPSLTIDGTAKANSQKYDADFRLLTSAGDLAACGSVALTPETYHADIDVHRFDVGKIMPSLGIGPVTATISAHGAGFNPLLKRASTDIELDLASIVYNKMELDHIHALITLHDSYFDIFATSLNREMDFDISGNGTIAPDNYTFDVNADIRKLDLMALGLSPTMNNGNGIIHLAGSASPDKWIYNVDLSVENLDWNLPDNYIHLPAGANARILTTPDSTNLHLDSYLTNIDFVSSEGLKKVIEGFTNAADIAMKQVDKRNLDIDMLQSKLPKFDLTLGASGNGLLQSFLSSADVTLDTVSLILRNDTSIYGYADARQLYTTSIKADTVTLKLTQRNGLLNYIAHIGNRPGTFDEFADVRLRGYLGNNRFSAMLHQKNITGETGYRIGLTGAITDDDVLTVHFTPLNAIIAYIPWTINDDNYIDCSLKNYIIHANLGAKSSESSILVKTEPLPTGGDQLIVKLDNIHIEELLRMSVTAPPITATVNSDIRIMYDGHKLNGDGTLDIINFTYEKTRIGDFDFSLHAGLGLDGNTEAKIGLNVDNHEAMSLNARFIPTEEGLQPENVQLNLTQFPLNIANAFLGKDIAHLSGALSGSMAMTGSFTKPLLNGSLTCDSIKAFIPMIGTTLRIESDPITVDNSILHINDFNIFSANKSPLTLGGSVDMTNFANLGLDLSANANNFQLIGNDYKAKSDIYGKLFLNLNATVKGNMKALDANANLSILGNTDLTYQMNAAAQALQQAGNGEDVVKFVNLNDSTQVNEADSITPMMAMRVNATLNIVPGTEITVNLNDNGTNRVQVHPSGTLNYFQNYMGDMKLNGQLNTGSGQAKYGLPIVGERIFVLNPDSYILWNGDIMNPVLNVHVTDDMKANVVQASGNSQMVNFIVYINVTNTLSQPSLSFDLATNDDLTIQNEIESMTADQRSNQAMNLLLYGQYTGQNTRTASSRLSGNMLYGILTSQLNSLTSRYVKGVDLSFGIDQYDRTVDGSTSSATSYSYQLSKSLFDNRFKILVGGNYSTDAESDDIAENLISDISLEYILKQTNTLSMSAKLFRHTGYESILEGEITEMGVGLVMRRKLNNLLHLFRFRRNRKPALTDTVPADSLKTEVKVETSSDSLTQIKKP